MMKKRNKVILLDADVISHFIAGGQIYLLPTILPYPSLILDNVYSELERFRKKKIVIDNLINQRLFEVIQFPEDQKETKKEYFWLKKMRNFGDGEAACLAVARHNKHIVGSSNLKDIRHYCQMHGITYLTTMDFLCYAFHTGKVDIADCNAFINSVRAKGSKLPVAKMEDFNCPNYEL
jgi:hypothetical protein